MNNLARSVLVATAASVAAWLIIQWLSGSSSSCSRCVAAPDRGDGTGYWRDVQ